MRTYRTIRGKRKQPDNQGHLLLEEGEYGKHKDGVWMVRPTGSHTGNLKRHTVTEHDDGSITVKPSIKIDDGRTVWHGYLRQGNWTRL